VAERRKIGELTRADLLVFLGERRGKEKDAKDIGIEMSVAGCVWYSGKSLLVPWEV
jgi:hypothetical protein